MICLPKPLESDLAILSLPLTKINAFSSLPIVAGEESGRMRLVRLWSGIVEGMADSTGSATDKR
jgi:hypothetical protein